MEWGSRIKQLCIYKQYKTMINETYTGVSMVQLIEPRNCRSLNAWIHTNQFGIFERGAVWRGDWRQNLVLLQS
jgi:hypothetical protein